jgi:hypothetical protein
MPDDPTGQTPATALPPMRPGEILGTAFGLYRRRWRTLLAIMAIAVPFAVSFPSTRVLPGPGSEYQVIVHHRVVAVTASWTVTALLVLAGLGAVLGLAIFVGAIAAASAAAAAGEDLGAGRSYRFGIARVWSLLWVILMVWLLVGLAGLLIIPGIVVGVMLVATVPALVVEGRRGWTALSRSRSLVAGQWWHAFGTILLAWLLLGLAVNVVDNAAGGLGHGWLVETGAQALSIMLATPYAALVGMLLYLDLRARTEPLDAELLRRDLRSAGIADGASRTAIAPRLTRPRPPGGREGTRR